MFCVRERFRERVTLREGLGLSCSGEDMRVSVVVRKPK